MPRPTLTTAEVDVRYQPIAGPPLTKRYVVAPRSRFTIWVNGERFPGLGTALATTALSATVTSANGVPVVVERTMWWPSPAPMWMDAHSSDARVNVAVVESWFPGVTGKRFGVLVESLGVTPAQIVVEGVFYFEPPACTGQRVPA